jgi:hypothetical protein
VARDGMHQCGCACVRLRRCFTHRLKARSGVGCSRSGPTARSKDGPAAEGGAKERV